MRVTIQLELDENQLTGMLPKSIESRMRREVLNSMINYGESNSSSVVKGAGVIKVEINQSRKREVRC